MKSLIHLILLNFFMISAFGQPIYFNNQYVAPETYWGSGNSILTLNDNYLIIGIGSGYGGMDNKNIILGLTDSFGDILQWKNYGEPGYHYYPSLGASILSCDDNIIIAGSKQGTNYSDGLLYKLNTDIDTVWSFIYHDTATENSFSPLRSIIENSSGRIIAVGQKTNQEDGWSDVLLLEVSDMGQMNWEKTFPIGYHDRPASLTEGTDKGYLIGGFNYNPGQAYSGSALVIKTDSLGNEEWTKWYGGAYRDGPAQVELAHDGNFIVGYGDALQEEIPGYPYCKITILKVDTDGVTIWENSYGGVFLWNTVSKIKKLPDGNYIAAGHTACEPMNARREGWLLKFDDNGDSIWYRQYSNVAGLAENNFHDIDLTQDGGFIMGGNISIYEEPIPPIHQLMWALKVDSMGCDTPGCATGTFLKEFPLFSEDEVELRIWPNPAKGKFEVRFSFAEASENESSGFSRRDAYGRVGESKIIRVYNSQGLKVEEIEVPEMVETMTVDVSGYNMGLYFVQLVVEGKAIANQKVVVR